MHNRNMNPEESVSQVTTMKRKANCQTTTEALKRKANKGTTSPVVGTIATTTNRLLRIVFHGKMRTLEELELMMNGWEDVCPTTTTITQQHKMRLLIPDGWIVEDIPRKRGTRIDRYYIDPVLGVRFRSYKEVVRHLTQELDHGQDLVAFDVNKPSTEKQHIAAKDNQNISSSYEKKSGLASESMISGNGLFDIYKSSDQINQVLHVWKRENENPFVNESMVPDHVMDFWRETFLFDLSAAKNPYLPGCVQKCLGWLTC